MFFSMPQLNILFIWMVSTCSLNQMQKPLLKWCISFSIVWMLQSLTNGFCGLFSTKPVKLVSGKELHGRFNRWHYLPFRLVHSKNRKTALEYMNHLNDTHQLGLETLKLSNIHIPGGLKFIKIIHKFSYLVMKVELNKREHGPLPNVQ